MANKKIVSVGATRRATGGVKVPVSREKPGMRKENARFQPPSGRTSPMQP